DAMRLVKLGDYERLAEDLASKARERQIKWGLAPPTYVCAWPVSHRLGFSIRAKLIAARNRTQLAGHEVIWRPGAGDGDVAVFEVPHRRVVAVLVFGHGVGLNEMGEVDQHSPRVGPLADDVLFQWRE